MGYHKRKKRTDKLPPFVALRWDMLNSKGYIILKPSSAKALPYFIGKGRNKTREESQIHFTFSFSEAKRLGFAPATFSRAIKDLVKAGFIDPVSKGGLRGYRKSNNKFTLSNRWERYGENNFKEIIWETFQPEPEL